MCRFFRWAVFVLLLYTLFCLIAGIVVADGTLHPQRRTFDVAAIAQGEALAGRTDSTIQDISISTPDHVQLRAWLMSHDAQNENVVLLLHGLSDNRLGMLGYAEFFLNHNYTVLMPDSRAHGQSGGAIATYGLLERNDISEWANWIQRSLHPKCIFGFGESMGAAQLLQSLQSTTLFCAVAAESSFSNLREIGYDRVGQFFHTGPWLGRTLLRPVIETAFFYSRWKYGLDLRLVSPETAVMNTRVPVLLIHGQIDSNIPIRHSRKIKSIASNIVLWEVPNADHCGAISVAPRELFSRLTAWFSDATSRSSQVISKERFA